MTTVLWIAMERDQIFPKPVLHMVLLKDSPAQTEELWHSRKSLQFCNYSWPDDRATTQSLLTNSIPKFDP
jgi:hypothetical protein